MTKIKLFCLPYAGGSAAIYLKWKEYINPNITIIPIELPGRGKRFNELLHEDLKAVVKDIKDFILEHLDDTPYAIFGYSMGSWIAYELIKEISSGGYYNPIHAFFAAKEAPHNRRKSKELHKLPEEEFSKEILKLGGTSPEVFSNEELKEIFITILKADYKIVETYTHEGEPYLLNCNITVLCGREDSFLPEEIKSWEELTQKECSILAFDGGHFFIHDRLEEVVKHVNNTLQRQIVRSSYI